MTSALVVGPPISVRKIMQDAIERRPLILRDNPKDPAGAIAPAGEVAHAAIVACGLRHSGASDIPLTAAHLTLIRRIRPVFIHAKGGGK